MEEPEEAESWTRQEQQERESLEDEGCAQEEQRLEGGCRPAYEISAGTDDSAGDGQRSQDGVGGDEGVPH